MDISGILLGLGGLVAVLLTFFIVNTREAPGIRLLRIHAEMYTSNFDRAALTEVRKLMRILNLHISVGTWRTHKFGAYLVFHWQFTPAADGARENVVIYHPWRRPRVLAINFHSGRVESWSYGNNGTRLTALPPMMPIEASHAQEILEEMRKLKID